MPYDAKEKKFYKINYEKLFDYFQKEMPPIFNEENLQSAYINQWLYYLKKYDQQSTALEAIPMFFQTNIDFNGKIVYIHFNVFHLIRLAKNRNYSMINMCDFTKETEICNVSLTEFKIASNILWTKPDEYDSRIDYTNEPILVCQYPSVNAGMIVVDGNHRVMQHIEKKEKNIPAIIFEADEIIADPSCFLSDFDRYLYLFWIDINNLQKINGSSDDKLLKYSLMPQK